MPRIEIAFPLWIAIESRCLKKSVSRTSPVMAMTRLPSSAVKLFACSPHDPNILKASGMKRCVAEGAAYFVIFEVSAFDAAAPVLVAVA